MKNLILSFMLLAFLGCAMDTQKEEETQGPAAPGQVVTVDQARVDTPPATEPAVPEVIETPHVDLVISEIVDLIEIEFTRHAQRKFKLGKKPIQIPRNMEDSVYTAKVEFPKDQAPILIVEKVGAWKNTYPMNRIGTLPADILEAYQSDDHNDIKIKDHAFEDAPNVKHRTSTRPMYEVYLKADNTWHGKFRHTQSDHLAQFPNFKEGAEAHFIEFSNQVFGPTLYSAPVQKALREILDETKLLELRPADISSIYSEILIRTEE